MGRRISCPGGARRGPWSGSYFTAMEGSLRAPFVIRWPGRVPHSATSNEIVHQVDVFTTLAGFAGADIPQDRMIDGVDQRDFFLGRRDRSARQGFPCYVGDTLAGAKWRNWKVHFVWQQNKFDPVQTLGARARSTCSTIRASGTTSPRPRAIGRYFRSTSSWMSFGPRCGKSRRFPWARRTRTCRGSRWRCALHRRLLPLAHRRVVALGQADVDPVRPARRDSQGAASCSVLERPLGSGV